MSAAGRVTGPRFRHPFMGLLGLQFAVFEFCILGLLLCVGIYYFHADRITNKRPPPYLPQLSCTMPSRVPIQAYVHTSSGGNWQEGGRQQAGGRWLAARWDGRAGGDAIGCREGLG